MIEDTGLFPERGKRTAIPNNGSWCPELLQFYVVFGQQLQMILQVYVFDPLAQMVRLKTILGYLHTARHHILKPYSCPFILCLLHLDLALSCPPTRLHQYWNTDTHTHTHHTHTHTDTEGAFKFDFQSHLSNCLGITLPIPPPGHTLLQLQHREDRTGYKQKRALGLFIMSGKILHKN